MKKLLTTTFLILITSAPSFAQLNVIDPASISKQVQQLAQMQSNCCSSNRCLPCTSGSST